MNQPRGCGAGGVLKGLFRLGFEFCFQGCFRLSAAKGKPPPFASTPSSPSAPIRTMALNARFSLIEAEAERQDVQFKMTIQNPKILFGDSKVGSSSLARQLVVRVALWRPHSQNEGETDTKSCGTPLPWVFSDRASRVMIPSIDV